LASDLSDDTCAGTDESDHDRIWWPGGTVQPLLPGHPARGSPLHDGLAQHRGPLIEGFGSDPGLTSPALGSPYNAGVSPTGNPLVGAHLFAIMDSLPPTDIEFGSVTTLACRPTRCVTRFCIRSMCGEDLRSGPHDRRAAGELLASKQESIHPHEEAAAGSPEIPGGVVYKPELRWLVDPNDLRGDGVRSRRSSLVQSRKGRANREVLRRRLAGGLVSISRWWAG